MPGFAVPIDSKVVGSHGIKVNSEAEYYYNYTWQIFQLAGHGFNDTALVHLKDMTLPTFTAQQDSYIASSLEYKWAKSVTWDDVKVSWYDTVGLADMMTTWQWNVWNPTTGLQVASQYKKRSQIDVYLPTGSSVITWCLIGSWPKIIRHGELTYTDSNIKLVEVTITYDWANSFTPYTKDSSASAGPLIDRVGSQCGKSGGSGTIVSPSDPAPPPSDNYPNR